MKDKTRNYFVENSKAGGVMGEPLPPLNFNASGFGF